MTHFNGALDGRGPPKLARKSMRIQAALVFADLLPGQSATFDLPEGQPAKRDMANAISGTARRVFGVGRYYANTQDQKLVITRRASVL